MDALPREVRVVGSDPRRGVDDDGPARTRLDPGDDDSFASRAGRARPPGSPGRRRRLDDERSTIATIVATIATIATIVATTTYVASPHRDDDDRAARRRAAAAAGPCMGHNILSSRDG